MKKMFLVGVAVACTVISGGIAAQGSTPPKEMTPAQYRQEVTKNVQNVVARFKKTDPGIDRFFKNSIGYVVFPRVGKAGFIFAAGHGDGELFEKGKMIGFASITLVSIGLTAGVQDYAEIIFFEDKAALDRFKRNNFEFAANASAVILSAGAADSNNYAQGVAVFVQPNGGAMAEASVGTQKFKFKPEGSAAPAKKN